MKVYMLLDRSGSMQGTLWTEAIGSINTYVENLDSKSTEIFLAAFDTGRFDVVRDTTVGKWKPLSVNELSPCGGTPLFDSVARMIDLAVENNDPKTILVVMTDGYENASQTYRTTAQIKEKLESIKSKEWPTIFLGASFQQIDEQSASIGVSSSNSVYTTASNMRNFAHDLATRSMVYGGARNSAEAAASMHYSVEEKAAFANDTGAQPSK